MKLLAGAAIVWVGISVAHAQAIKPGLWEITNQMQGNSEAANAMARMQKEMAQMPPAQRKMMEDMLSKQGMQIGSAAGGGMALKICMTQEMIDRNEVASQQGDCQHTSSPRSGNSMKFSFVCTKPPSSGEGQVTFTSPEAYTTWVAVTSTRRGKPEKMEMNTSGRWLGSDCGGVKPIAMPKK
ncbi:MAG: DUF3617 domain-containing protein [Burkholderiales bacterium]|nr:DUF3617 domain-containing protein [Burkholderiales bacterium]